MRLRLIACEIAFRELCLCVANSKNIIDLQFLPKGLHDIETEDMLARIQKEIDETDPEEYQAILLGYGLCNNGVIGLKARHIPLIIPRAHDCITLFLGSRQRYKDYFDKNPGTYFRTTGWLERNFAKAGENIYSKLGLDKTYEEYVEKYGEENAKYIMEMMGSWEKNYNKLTFIDMKIAGFLGYEEKTRKDAEEKGWEFDHVEGDMSLLQRLVDGDGDGKWDEIDFLTVKPGEQIAATNDDDILRASPVLAHSDA